MMDREELIRWLTTLPKGCGCYIDDGGLCLRCDEDDEAYLEVGGKPLPEDEEEEDADGC
jgi:hypothetical protein